VIPLRDDARDLQGVEDCRRWNVSTTAVIATGDTELRFTATSPSPSPSTSTTSIACV